jgi:hypothetical protein
MALNMQNINDNVKAPFELKNVMTNGFKILNEKYQTIRRQKKIVCQRDNIF